ncbi:hypothetical protein TNIN_97061 [Trichonephila inaurata madagascariensis]|uniref:Uncharacterized protein n=1 Tax=Trichonephila inaurata madagascariensis TaxID=2747483 RepID=A0A8X6XT00_9ARAC|nr:hypothetical protein TNIN_97061 [Trichonephila inaurata madagascariensis]
MEAAVLYSPMILLISSTLEGGLFDNVMTSETKIFLFVTVVNGSNNHNCKSIIRESVFKCHPSPRTKCFFLLVVKGRKILGHYNCVSPLCQLLSAQVSLWIPRYLKLFMVVHTLVTQLFAANDSNNRAAVKMENASADEIQNCCPNR